MRFEEVASKSQLGQLYTLFYPSLVAPFDGMWDEIIGYARHWQIKHDRQMIGFFAINEENTLLNFFIKEAFLPLQVMALEKILSTHKIKQAVTSTNHPVFFSACLDLAKKVTTHSYLFADSRPIKMSPPILDNKVKPALKTAQMPDFEDAVEFCIAAIGAPREWLEGYYTRLISRKELFLWQDQRNMEIVGVCEARKSDTQPGIGDVGMIVASQYRKQGVGTYLLNQAKEQCYRQNLQPICSCERDNIGSRKSIHKVGFVSRHRLVRVEF